MFESPALAVAQVVDAQIAALQTDLAETVPVKTDCRNALDPSIRATKRSRCSIRSGPVGSLGMRIALARQTAVRSSRGDAPASPRAGACRRRSKTVIWPSGSMRTDNSAPTRPTAERAHAPLSRLLPENRHSAFGALAATAPSASRTACRGCGRMRPGLVALDLRTRRSGPCGFRRNCARSRQRATATRSRVRSARRPAATTDRRIPSRTTARSRAHPDQRASHQRPSRELAARSTKAPRSWSRARRSLPARASDVPEAGLRDRAVRARRGMLIFFSSCPVGHPPVR